MKFGLILCEDAPVWGGQVGYGEFYLSRFKSENPESDEWVPIYAVEGCLPSSDEMKSFNGFVISGAHFSVNDDEQWIRNLENFIREIFQHNAEEKFEEQNKIHLYGICFGHQLVAKALGGKVDVNGSKKFIFGAERVELHDDLRQKGFFKNAFGDDRQHITFMQSHGECVVEVPVGALLVGSSRSCDTEVLMYNDCILTSQGHPEFTKDAMVKNIVPRLRQSSRWTEDQINEAMAAMDAADTDACVQMVKEFLIGNRSS